MKERAINLTADEVRGILAGRKTQLRRPVNMRYIGFIGGRGEDADPGKWGFGDQHGCWHVLDQSAPDWYGDGMPHESYRIACPLGVPGDHLWVRESWAHDAASLEALRSEVDDCYGSSHGPYYRADQMHEGSGLRWRSTVQMPRWASRLTLAITDVRVERLQNISDADAIAEGIEGPYRVPHVAYKVPGDSKPRYSTAVAAFETWWDLQHEKKAPWSTAPFVWVISFKVLQR